MLAALRKTLRNLVFSRNLNVLKQTDTSRYPVKIFLTLNREAEIKGTQSSTEN